MKAGFSAPTISAPVTASASAMAKFVAAPPSIETVMFVSVVIATWTARAVPPLAAMVKLSMSSKALAALLKSMLA